MIFEVRGPPSSPPMHGWRRAIMISMATVAVLQNNVTENAKLKQKNQKNKQNTIKMT